MVERVTTHTSAAKMNRGKRGKPNRLQVVSQDTVILRGKGPPGARPPLPWWGREENEAPPAGGGTGPGGDAIKDERGGGQGQIRPAAGRRLYLPSRKVVWY
jgi:hypothetical protein